MLAAASSLFSRSSLNANYVVQGSPASALGSALANLPSPSSMSSSSQPQQLHPPSTLNDAPPFTIGLWKILRAQNKSNHKVRSPRHDLATRPEPSPLPADARSRTHQMVSVWMFEKKALDGSAMKPAGRELVLEALRKEVRRPFPSRLALACFEGVS